MSRSIQIQQARDLLGVAADSDPATLTHAYRRLARANHPDVSVEPDAAQRFATITAAYRLLRDHAESATSEHRDAQVPVHVCADATFGPSVSVIRDRARSWTAGPAFIVSSAEETLHSPAAGRARWRDGSVADSPIVAGPVTVEPVRPKTSRRPTQEAP